jgi:hypothetical protein
MKNEMTIGTKTFAISELELLQGYVDQSEVVYRKHQRAKNWVATVRFDPAAPNSLARAFWKRGSGSYVAVPSSLAVGEVLEFGADYYTRGGYRQEGRQYHRVLAITPHHIVMREAGKPGKRPLRPVALDIEAAQIAGDSQQVNPLVDTSDADLVAELQRRGVGTPICSTEQPPKGPSENSPN